MQGKPASVTDSTYAAVDALHTQVSWLLSAYSDEERSADSSNAVGELRSKCEEAAVNGTVCCFCSWCRACALLTRVHCPGKWPVSTTRAAAALLEVGTQCHDAPRHESQPASRKVRCRSLTDAGRSEVLKPQLIWAFRVAPCRLCSIARWMWCAACVRHQQTCSKCSLSRTGWCGPCSLAILQRPHVCSFALHRQSNLKQLVAKLSIEARACRAGCFSPLVLTAVCLVLRLKAPRAARVFPWDGRRRIFCGLCLKRRCS